jgi:hypothetical protein
MSIREAVFNPALMADFGVLKYYNYSCVVSMKLFRSRRRFLQVLSLLALLVQKYKL